MQPFSITLFATTGDPEGIRHLDKSNWSGYGVFFNRVLNSTQRTEREKRRNARLDRRLSEGHAQEDKAGNRANTGGKGKKNPNRMRVGISHYGGSGGNWFGVSGFSTSSHFTLFFSDLCVQSPKSMLHGVSKS